LSGQITFIEQEWANWLPQSLRQKLQQAKAIYEEEAMVHFAGPGPSPMPLFGQGDGSDLPAAFTKDTDWMSRAVMLAKSVYVWLDQLSGRYQQGISKLGDIPEEEFANLARQGFNALWLIGIWERSRASRKIKQLCGNPEAEASAYALHAYRIAEDLGGEEALAELERRCRQHGIRLACDVVPNHTGIDSEWIVDHPEWFIQADHPPYPAYSFNGPDLCANEGVSIRIEDGYWDHSDAAVVCEHHDHASGERSYIYHGNDGTHMPWNDTAQLNFLLPEVRRAMSDLIIAVAKRFSLIRFDAAMTLARKHFRRLWFPPPGGGAGVPSRAGFSMPDKDFAMAFPTEFWREVVDRINREAPDTLLIAEAFWLMESYFVRNLGMHRVYNSAFMNMLKQEENAKYRKILKELLAYNPEIMKRYVNFMNNPDEATAVEQFGKGDKYFGVATLLATLPGLPMFGHGQIEGYREKYGMEYRRAYWQEGPDIGFIEHHEKQIFPLLQCRHDFAGVENFSLFDFETDHGICENIYSFSNGPIGRKYLVVYNNSPHPVQGRIHNAAPKASLQQEGMAQPMPPLWQELGLEPGNHLFCRFRNLHNEEHLLPLDRMVNGLELSLKGYEHQVFSDFRPLEDPDGLWQTLFIKSRGQAMSNLDRERQRLQYKETWLAFTKLVDLERLHILSGTLSAAPPPPTILSLQKELLADLDGLLYCLSSVLEVKRDESTSTKFVPLLTALPRWLAKLSSADIPNRLMAEAWSGLRNHPGLGVPVLAWLLLRELGQRLGLHSDSECLNIIRSLGLDFAWQEQFTSHEQQRQVSLSLLLLQTSNSKPATDSNAFADLCTDNINTNLLGVHRHAGNFWFNREGMMALVGVVALQAGVQQLALEPSSVGPEPTKEISEMLRQRLARAAAVGYRLDKFLSLG
jgi:glycosidase